MSKVHLTVREFIENIRRNGLGQYQGSLFATTIAPPDRFNPEGYLRGIGPLPKPGDIVTHACAFGQGLINSNAIVDFDKYEENLTEEEMESDTFLNIFAKTWQLNDLRGADIETIADILEDKFSDHLDEIIVLDAFDWTPYLPPIAETESVL